MADDRTTRSVANEDHAASGRTDETAAEREPSPRTNADQVTHHRAEEKASKRAPGWKKTRRTLATISLVALVATMWVSSQTHYLRTCDDLVARVGTAPLVSSCRPLSVTDAPMIVILIVVGILLFPELSALEIPGVIRLEKELEEQARRQDDIVAAIHRLEVSQHQQVNVLVAARVGELVGEQSEKRRRFESDAS